MPLRFRAEALEEIDAAVDWYERQRKGRGEELFGAALVELGQIEESPQRFPFWSSRVKTRYAVMQHFPFTIYFEEIESQLVILAFNQGSRRPPRLAARRKGT